MAGITETVFRRLCKRAGADIVVSEMVSAEGVCRGTKRSAAFLRFEDVERPLGIQLFGASPERLAAAARHVEESAKPDFIELNCGCPVPKVVRRNGGCALLRNPSLYTAILSAMVKAVNTPVTVKIRSGWHEQEWVDVQFARIAQDCGVSAVTLHPRSKTMGFGGHALWERIAEVKHAVDIPVIGSGDVTCGDKAADMFAETGCDAVMIGRAALGNPWIFADARKRIHGAHAPSLSPQERKAIVMQHIHEYRETYGEHRASREMKKHVAWYFKGMTGVSRLRRRVFTAHSSFELEELVEEYFARVEAADEGGRLPSRA